MNLVPLPVSVIATLGPPHRLQLGRYLKWRGEAALQLQAEHLTRELQRRTARSLLILDQALHRHSSSLALLNLRHICDEEFSRAMSLPVPSVSIGRSFEAFLDDLVIMRSRKDVLALFLTNKDEHVNHQCCRDTHDQDDESWVNHFLSNRVIWHMLHEDFVRHCDDVPVGTVITEGIDVVGVVSEAATSVAQMCRAEFTECPRIDITCDDSVLVAGCRDNITYYLTELLKNACVASVDLDRWDHPVKVDVSTLSISNVNSFCITIQDEAGGIPAAVQEKMWRFGWSGHDVQRRIAGFGIGLPLARTYIELLGGTLEMTTTEGTGTMFKITHPLVGEEKVYRR